MLFKNLKGLVSALLAWLCYLLKILGGGARVLDVCLLALPSGGILHTYTDTGIERRGGKKTLTNTEGQILHTFTVTDIEKYLRRNNVHLHRNEGGGVRNTVHTHSDRNWKNIEGRIVHSWTERTMEGKTVHTQCTRLQQICL